MSSNVVRVRESNLQRHKMDSGYSRGRTTSQVRFPHYKNSDHNLIFHETQNVEIREQQRFSFLRIILCSILFPITSKMSDLLVS